MKYRLSDLRTRSTSKFKISEGGGWICYSKEFSGAGVRVGRATYITRKPLRARAGVGGVWRAEKLRCIHVYVHAKNKLYIISAIKFGG